MTRSRPAIGLSVFLGLTIVSCIVASPAVAVVVHDESLNGDLSNDRLIPTAYALALGTNSLVATSVSGDREYVRFTVPAGFQLSQVVLASYAGIDGTAFIGVQAGSTLTEPPTGTNVANLLGWTHFGPVPGNVGTDILDNMGVGAGAIGFVGALAAGDYTFWIQQTGANAATYQMDFILVPAPGVAGLIGLAGVFASRRRR